MLVHIENLVKRYGDLLALDHLSLDIEEGEIFGLLGPNGSGKTTAINCLLALLKYDKGTITIFGKDMKPDSYDIKQDIGVVMQNVAVFEQMSVYENIDYFCGLYIRDKQKRKELVEEAIAFTGLSDFRKMRPKKLSGGLLRRLNIACGIVHKPRLIIMDEPTVAVDPQSRNKILEGIVELNRQGSTIIYTSHYMEEVEQICTRIAIIDHGRVLASGTTEELKKMIKTGETITIEAVALTKNNLADIRSLSHVFDLSYQDQTMILRCSGAKHNLIRVLNYLQEQDIPFGRVFSELPTMMSSLRSQEKNSGIKGGTLYVTFIKISVLTDNTFPLYHVLGSRISAHPWNPVLCVLWKYRSCRNRRDRLGTGSCCHRHSGKQFRKCSIFPDISE